ncbi:MAG TPA: prolipoprotein diacylglyceryl transferase [Phycisphaeraceae bacterium]
MLATLAAWLHDIDPYALKLWEGGPIRWYGLSYLLGFFIGYLLIRRVTRVGSSPLHPQRVADLVFQAAIGVMVGGRLGYVFFYKPALLWTFDSHVPFWGVLAINQGGMASHGGMIGAILAALLFAHRHHQNRLFLLDLLAFGAPLGLFFGRIANFINGELIGRPAPASLPWAVKFPQELYDNPDLARQALDAVPYPFGNSVDQIITAIQQGNQAVIRAVEPLLTPRHPSQLYAAVLEGLCVFAVLLIAWRKPRKPGVIGALFCISYAVARIGDEFFRRPDVHIQNQEFALLGVTRGQWLSALLLLLGLGLMWYAIRRPTQPMGAWRRGPWTGQGGNQPPTQGRTGAGS